MVNYTGIVTLISANLKQAKALTAVSQNMLDPGNRERHFIQADSCRAAVPSETSFPLKGYFNQESHKRQRKSVISDPQPLAARTICVFAQRPHSRGQIGTRRLRDNECNRAGIIPTLQSSHSGSDHAVHDRA